MDKLKKTLSGKDEQQEDEEQGIMAQVLDASTLSWNTRLKGFGICFVLGFIFSIMGAIMFPIPRKGAILFGIFYSLGNVVSLSSSVFLMGPVNQCKKMFAPTRLIATILVFVFLFLTLMSALKWQKTGLVILFCILQFLALAWYSLSYIPYARNMLKNCCGSVMG